MSDYLQKTLLNRTSCLDSTDGAVEWKLHLISLLGTATKLSSRTSGQVVLDPTDRVVEWKMHLTSYIHCALNKDPT